MKQTINVQVKKAKKQDKIYYNIVLEVEGMTFQVEPKFLNNKQKALLRHKLARAVGDEKAKVNDDDYDGPYDSAGSLVGEKYTDKNGKEHVLRLKR